MNPLKNMVSSRKSSSSSRIAEQRHSLNIRKNPNGNSYSVKRGCCTLLGNLIIDTSGVYAFHQSGRTAPLEGEMRRIDRKLLELNTELFE